MTFRSVVLALFTCLSLGAASSAGIAAAATSAVPTEPTGTPLATLSNLPPPLPATAAQPLGAGFREESLVYRFKGRTVTRKVFFWYPTYDATARFDYKGQIGNAKVNGNVASGRHPALVFSHGIHGAGDQTIFLTEHLARAGYLVIGINHADALGSGQGKTQTTASFLAPERWTDAVYLDRRADIVAAIDELFRGNRTNGHWLFQRVDSARVGAIGHSLGGYTILSMIGARPAWFEPRIRAALLLSPYAMPYLRDGVSWQIQVPTMLQGGTLDLGITPFLPSLYERLSSPKYFLTLRGESHLAWTNLLSLGKTTEQTASTGNGRWISEYSTAFFDRHLRTLRAPLLNSPNRSLQDYAFSVIP